MMRNRDFEAKIKAAFEHTAPDHSEQLKGLLSQCGRGAEHMNSNYNTANSSKKRIPLWARWTAAAAAVLVLGAGVFLGARYYSQNMVVDSQILLDVNPSIELKLNAKDTVIELSAKNDDAVRILDGMDLKGTDLNVAVNALLGSLVKHGYIGEVSNSILVTVESEDAEHGSQLQSQLVEEIDRILAAQSIDGAVLSQNLSEDSEEQLKALSSQYGISMGKAALVRTLIATNPAYRAEDLSGLTINELNLLLASQKAALSDSGINSVGAASDKAFIGEEKAKQAALAHAGLTEQQVTIHKVKLDFEDGQVEYEVEFFTSNREYEYDINAKTGEVLSYDTEEIRSSSSSASGSSSSDSSSGAGSSQAQRISMEKAKQIALQHAGVNASDATFYKAKLDRDDGLEQYELKFYTSSKEYEYELRASDGAVLSYDYEEISSGASSSSSSSATASIDESQARKLAQQRAPGANITSCKLETEDGVAVYEIELRQGSTEYECEIRKSDGAVLKWKSEIDDD